MAKKDKKTLPADDVKLMDWDEYTHLCHLIAGRVKESFKPELVLGIGDKGVVVAATIASILHLEMYPVKLSRRVSDRIVRKQPKVLVPQIADLKNKRVLIIDAASLTGEQIKSASEEIKKHLPAAMFTAVLVRRGDFEPNSYAIYSKKRVQFPWVQDALK